MSNCLQEDGIFEKDDFNIINGLTDGSLIEETQPSIQNQLIFEPINLDEILSRINVE